MKKVLLGILVYMVAYAFGKGAGRRECGQLAKTLLPPDAVRSKTVPSHPSWAWDKIALN